MFSHKKYPDFPLRSVYMQYLKNQFELILILIAFGAMISAAQAKEPFLIESELIISNRYRRDELDWNIAGDASGNNPNILSELTWEAEADWNLRTDFAHPKSFEHQADGNGVILSTGLNIYFTSNLALNLDYTYQDWSTDEGRDTVFFEDGIKARTLLNDANWESHAIGIGILFNF